MPRWGMIIDLDRCNGCAACVAACKLENNVPTVGAEAMQAGRSLFWMDLIQRVEGEYPNVEVTYMPRPCFQCENAPCTKVCPVRATYVND
ncbi:MAG: 4Fe-4S dicluster domain-containing protein, partial [Candidatus Neomarinimicrobiota bacterium]